MGYFTKETDELSHHGILGQKWGVRRFENEDGSLTAAGRKRYDTDSNGNYKKLNNAFSAKAAGHKALSKVYGLNEKAYAKSNKTLSSMNKAAKEEQLKKAEQAQNEANEKKANRTGLTPEQKKAVKTAAIVGAAAVGTALAVYGGYKLANSPQGKAAIAKVLSKSKNLKDTVTNSVKAERAMSKQEKIDNLSTASKLAKDFKTNHTMPPKLPKQTETVKTQVKTVSPEKFTYETFKPTQFNFDKFGYEKFQTAAQANDDLVNDLLRRNAKALGM